MDVLALDGDQVLFGAVLAVASGLLGPQFPAKARSLEQVEHGLGQALKCKRSGYFFVRSRHRLFWLI